MLSDPTPTHPMYLPEYRVTRPSLYRDARGRMSAPTQMEAGGRQGHYIRALHAADAVAQLADAYNDLVFDVQHVKGEGADYTVVRRFLRNGTELACAPTPAIAQPAQRDAK